MSEKHRSPRPLKRTVLREELLILTGSPLRAVILNHFLHWTGRFFECDQAILEEKIAAAHMGRQSLHTFLCSQSEAWFFKRMVDLKDDLMLEASEADLWSSLAYLMKKGWVEKRQKGEQSQQETIQFRCHIEKIQRDLAQIGYTLPHFSLWGPFAAPPCLSVEYTDKGDGHPSPCRQALHLPDGSDLNLSDPSGLFLKEDGKNDQYTFSL